MAREENATETERGAPSMQREVARIAANFAVAGELQAVEPFGPGHINDSYRLTYRRGTTTARFLLQRINAAIFRNPPLVMDNIRRVTVHIRQRLELERVGDVLRRVLTLVPTHAGEPYYLDNAASCWRLYPFIEHTRACDSVETSVQAEQAGRAFGRFQSLLADLPPPRLHETIPDFHNTPLRFVALDAAVRADTCGRAAAARAEIELAFQHRALAGTLLDLQRCGAVPERVVHNDAKVSNVLLDETTAEGLCVVDLDTVMPGLSLFDFGDMLRSMTTTAAEDETDLSRVEVEMPLFEGLARGYLEAASAFLTPVEHAHLVTAGQVITLEQGVRFLTDYLNGDTYYKTHRPNHNLERCRAQFKLVHSMVRHQEAMERFVAGL
jgi:aminoglycoside phosphotransferase (APT) family kinase protein